MDLDKEIAEHMESLQTTVNESNVVRAKLTDKLLRTIDDMELLPGGEKSTVTMVKLDIIKAVNELLSSKESSIVSAVKTMMSKKTNTENEKHNEQVVEMLKMISTKIQPNAANTLDENKVDEKLKEAFEKSGESISEEELVLNT